MTEPEQPNPDNNPIPVPDEPNGSPTPPPPPSPYGQTPYPDYQQAQVPPQGSPYAPPQPTQPYGQQPYPGQAQTPGSQPQPPYPYAPQGQQQPYYGQPPVGAYGQPPYPPYPGQPPYPVAPMPPKKHKVWPWVLLGIVVVFLLGIGGCVSCMSCAMLAEDTYSSTSDSNSHGHRYGYDDNYNYDYGYDNGDDGLDYGYDAGEFTLDDIKGALSLPIGTLADGKYTPGVYEVGASKDLKPGLYFVEGSQTTESNYYVFEANAADAYAIDKAVVYFGNYFVQLEEGEVFALAAADNLRMYPIADATFKPEAPYQSGLYRVGTDIPAGTYAIAVQDGAATATDQESAAYVMKDLDFDEDSITDTKYTVKGGTQSVTVKDGDWLELFAATATPAE